MRYELIVLSTLFFGSVFGQGPALVPEYDVDSLQLRIYEVHRPLVLFCNITGTNYTGLSLTWTKNGDPVSEVSELQNRYEVLNAENKFIISRTIEEDGGLYQCLLPALNLLGQINVVSNVASRLPKNTQLIEGESLWIVCRVVGSNPTITWILPNNQTLNASTDRIILEHEHGINNSALYIAEVRLEDRGNYICQVSNIATEYGFEPGQASGMVRIRSKLAPLYPVGGILIEFFILFVVLYIYEKYFHDKDDELEFDDEDFNRPASTKNNNGGTFGENYKKNKAF